MKHIIIWQKDYDFSINFWFTLSKYYNQARGGAVCYALHFHLWKFGCFLSWRVGKDTFEEKQDE